MAIQEYYFTLWEDYSCTPYIYHNMQNATAKSTVHLYLFSAYVHYCHFYCTIKTHECQSGLCF